MRNFLCPKCNGDMHARTNRLGEPFIGCRRFPACDGCRDAEGYTFFAYDHGGDDASFERVRSSIEVLSVLGGGKLWRLGDYSLSTDRSRKLDEIRKRLADTHGGGSRARLISAMFRVACGKDEPVPEPLPPDAKINAAMSLSRHMLAGRLTGVDFNDRLARFQDAVGLSRRPYDEPTRQELAIVLAMNVDDLPAALPSPALEPIQGQPGLFRTADGQVINVRDRARAGVGVPVNNGAASAVSGKQEEKKAMKEEEKTVTGRLKNQGSMFAGAVADGLADAAVEEAGDVLLDTAKDLFDDEALMGVLLASPDGRELLKCMAGFVLDSIAVHGGIPKGEILSDVVRRQYRSSARRVGGPRIAKILKRATKLIEIGERMPVLRESNKTIVEELAEVPTGAVTR